MKCVPTTGSSCGNLCAFFRIHILARALVVQVRNIVVARWREDVSRYVATVINGPNTCFCDT